MSIVLAKIISMAVTPTPNDQYASACRVYYGLQWARKAGDEPQRYYIEVPFRAFGNRWLQNETVNLNIDLVRDLSTGHFNTIVQLADRGHLDIDGYWDSPYSPDLSQYNQNLQEYERKLEDWERQIESRLDYDPLDPDLHSNKTGDFLGTGSGEF